MLHKMDCFIMRYGLVLFIVFEGQACRTPSTAATSESSSSLASVDEQDFEEARLIFNGAGPASLNGVHRGDGFLLASEGRGKLMSEVLDESRSSWYQRGETCIWQVNHRIDIVGFTEKGDRALVLYHAPWQVQEQACPEGSYFFMPVIPLKVLEKCRQWLPQENCKYREDYSNGI